MTDMQDEGHISNRGVHRKSDFLHGFLIWTLWVLFYAVFFKIQTSGHSWVVALISSATSYYPFALLSILIWIICRKIPFGMMPVPVLCIVHFFISIVVSILWLGISFGMWYLAEGKAMLNYAELRAIVGWQFLFGMITYLLIAGIFYTIIYYRQYREKQLEEAELKLLMRDAQLKALKMQIHPHFFFNSLNSINALVTRNPKQAREMIAKVSDLLRLSLESRDKMLVPLREELELARLYLDIERIRFRDRMEVQEEVDDDILDVPFPAMVLQPLLENAVIHGISAHRGKGHIRLTLKSYNHRVYCHVSNTMGKQKSERSKRGTGLDNIHRRLDLIYSRHYDFHTFLSESGRFDVKLVIPMMENPHSLIS